MSTHPTKTQEHDDTPAGRTETFRDFKAELNMTASELEKWLTTEESRAVGQKSGDGAESTGHESGRLIIDILHKKQADLTDADFAHMHRVISYVRRHRAQGPEKGRGNLPVALFVEELGLRPVQEGLIHRRVRRLGGGHVHQDHPLAFGDDQRAAGLAEHGQLGVRQPDFPPAGQRQHDRSERFAVKIFLQGVDTHTPIFSPHLRPSTPPHLPPADRPAPARSSPVPPCPPTSPPPSKEHIAETFEGTARLLELKGENPFKVRAYKNAAEAVELYAGDLAVALANGGLDDVSGIGAGMAEHIAEMLETGRYRYFETLRAEFPPGIFELFELSGLGPKKIKALYEQLKVDGLPRLLQELDAGTVEKLPGFGKKTAENLRRGHRPTRAQRQPVPPGGRRRGRPRHRRRPARAPGRQRGLRGRRSLRRRKEILHDLDVVVSTREPEAVIDAFRHAAPPWRRSSRAAPTKVSVRLKGSGVACDLRVVAPEQYPFALHHFSGNVEHNRALRNRALFQFGWTINEYRIAPATPRAIEETDLGDTVPTAARGRPLPAPKPIPDIRDERDFFAALGLPFIPPELRENNGEIEAAERGQLPHLVTLDNLRGTFHCHTNQSDGRNTLDEMAAAAHDLGLQYLGIADHSRSSFQANGLDAPPPPRPGRRHPRTQSTLRR